MSYNCGVPGVSYNGFESDDFSATLDTMNKSDLERLLKNTEEIDAVARNSDQVKKVIAENGSLMEQNRKLAEENLALEPVLEEKKKKLITIYKQLEDAKNCYATLKSEIDAQNSRYSPSNLLDLIKVAVYESEDQSEALFKRFVDGEMDVKTFLDEFIPLRHLYHERFFKAKKLEELLSDSRQVTSSRPTLPSASVSRAPVSEAPGNPSYSGFGSLYPNLSGQSNRPSNPLSYGFNF